MAEPAPDAEFPAGDVTVGKPVARWARGALHSGRSSAGEEISVWLFRPPEDRPELGEEFLRTARLMASRRSATACRAFARRWRRSSQKAMKKDRTERYADAAKLAVDLHRHLTGERVSAPIRFEGAPPSTAPRAGARWRPSNHCVYCLIRSTRVAFEVIGIFRTLRIATSPAETDGVSVGKPTRKKRRHKPE